MNQVAMNVRRATAADTAFLRQLRLRVYRDVVLAQFGVWDEQAQIGWFEASLLDAELSIVEHEGEPIGAMGVKSSADRVFLAELQILPEFQGRGFGSALLEGLLDSAQRDGQLVTLRVLLQNRARSLYLRHGFLVTGTTETHFLMEWRPRR